MNKAALLFKDKALIRSGIYLFPKNYALQFVLECKKQHIVILGIDGFFIDARTTQPSLDHSIDFSITPFNETVYDEAIKFLEAREEDLFFEIVCSD
jgi:hypothetical protein